MKLINRDGIRVFVVPGDIEILAVCGDIHGEFRTLVNKLTQQLELENAIVIVAGDCGFGFHKYGYYRTELEYLTKKLEEKNIYIMLVRGNHDSPEYFKGDFFRTDRIFCVPDYSLIMFDDKNILCIGGGISIDRFPRIIKNFELDKKKYNGDERYRPKEYWSGEAPRYDFKKLEAVLEIAQPDIVVTHCAPSGITPVTKANLSTWAEHDIQLLDDVDIARDALSHVKNQIENKGIKIKTWYYGHYHFSNTEYFDETKFQLLDEMEIVEVR